MSEYTLTTVDDLYKDLLRRLGVNGHSGAIAEIDELRRVALILNHEMLEALKDYLYAQRRMLEKWADGDNNVKNGLWRKLHSCEEKAVSVIAKAKGESKPLATSEEKSE